MTTGFFLKIKLKYLLIEFFKLRNKISIEAPLIELSKKDIIKKGIKLGVDFRSTWTCYEGDEVSCGECTACSLRIRGFLEAKLIDPLPYKISIPWRENGCYLISN